MKTYIREVSGLKIIVPHGKCSYVNYNPQEIQIMTKENEDAPVLNLVKLVSNGISNCFKLANDFSLEDWERINPSLMILKGVKKK